MLIKKPDEIKSSEITDKNVYLNRRLFHARRGAGCNHCCYRAPLSKTESTAGGETTRREARNCCKNDFRQWSAQGFTVNEKLTSIEDITNYNNFYEFSTDKQSVASEAKGFVT